MKRRIVNLALILLVVFLWYINKSSEPTLVIEAEIMALEDVPEAAGLRRIQVRLLDGKIVWIETLAPFFYRVGYLAKLEVYDPILRERYYKFIAN